MNRLTFRRQGSSGVPEVRSGYSFTPPQSPPLCPSSGGGSRYKALAAGPARAIAEECERLFCGTLRGVFYGEKEAPVLQDPLAIGAYDLKRRHQDWSVALAARPPTDGDSVGDEASEKANIHARFELWDYSGGALFRGFTASKPRDIFPNESKTMFVFFDGNVIDRELKQGCVLLLTAARGTHTDILEY